LVCSGPAADLVVVTVVLETRCVEIVVTISDVVDIRVVLVMTSDVVLDGCVVVGSKLVVVLDACVVVVRKLVVVLEYEAIVELEMGGSCAGLIACGLPKTFLGSHTALI
jgi:hypothetical protein